MKKFESKKGFTLAELLIVVAIIAVLVAVSIPIFTSKLEKSRESTDVANMRAAKAAVVVAILDGEVKGKAIGDGLACVYDASKGILVEGSTAPSVLYGKGTTAVGDSTLTQDGYDPKLDYTKGYITVALKADSATLTWAGCAAGTSTTVGETTTTPAGGGNNG